MSHSITVTRTVTTSGGSALLLNTGYCRSVSGLLKFFETIFGAVCLGIVGYYGTHNVSKGFRGDDGETLFFLVSFGCLLTTALMFFTSLCSLITSSVLSKTLFEFLYHLVAFILYLSAALVFLINLTDRNKWGSREQGYDAKMTAAVLGLVNAVLYLLSAIFTYRVYRIA